MVFVRSGINQLVVDKYLIMFLNISYRSEKLKNINDFQKKFTNFIIRPLKLTLLSCTSSCYNGNRYNILFYFLKLDDLIRIP